MVAALTLIVLPSRPLIVLHSRPLNAPTTAAIARRLHHPPPPNRRHRRRLRCRTLHPCALTKPPPTPLPLTSHCHDVVAFASAITAAVIGFIVSFVFVPAAANAAVAFSASAVAAIAAVAAVVAAAVAADTTIAATVAVVDCYIFRHPLARF